jgi:hypothetical protein
MNGKILIIGVVVALLLPTMPYVMAAGTITIEANSRFYKPGDTVTLSGSTSAHKQVYLSVNNTQGEVFKTTVSSDLTGKYQASFPLTQSAYIDLSNKATTYFTVTNITPTDLANNMIKLAEDAQARTEKLFQELQTQKVTLLPEAQKDHGQGVTELNNAKSQLSQGHPWESLAAARNAMIHFRDAIRDAWKSAKVNKVEDKTAESLNAAIQRGQDLLQKLSQTVEKLKADGKDMSVAQTALADAKTQLDSATASVQANKLVDAEKEIDAAKTDLQKVVQDLKTLASIRAHDVKLKFLNSAEARADNLEAQLKKLRNENNKGRVDTAIAKIEEAKGKISQAITALMNGKDDAALRGLWAANNAINIGIGNIDSGKVSANLSNINMLQAKIQFLQRTEEQMKKWGMDTKTIQSQIEDLQTQLTQAQQITTP